MTDSLREWADTCEARALDALDTSPALAPNVLLEVAMLLDQRADYIEQRGQVPIDNEGQARIRELVKTLLRIDEACRGRIEAANPTHGEALVAFAQHIRDLARVPL